MMHYHDNQMLRKRSIVKTQPVERWFVNLLLFTSDAGYRSCTVCYCIAWITKYSHVYINMYKYLFKMHQTWWLGTVLQCHCSWWHFDKQLSPVLLAFQLQRKQGGKDWLKTGSIEQKDSNHYLVTENPLDVKDIEIQPGFKPGSSECQSDTLTNWTTGALALEQRMDGISIVQLC